jgi:hypothetical protein
MLRKLFKTKTLMSQLWRWHTGWRPGWKAYQAYLEGDETLISGLLPDETAVRGLLERIRDLNLTLVSVNMSTPSTQDTDENNDESSR